MKLLTIDNPKTVKGESIGFLTGILYLAPHRIADKAVNLCPASTPGCRQSCLYTTGRGRYDNTKQARVIKTIHFLNNKEGFIDQLDQDIKALKRKASKLGLKPTVRLNGTSDIAWHHIAPQLFESHPDVQFYDYTKVKSRMFEVLPTNYHLTFSVSETTTEAEIQELNGKTKAIVVNGLNSYNGDEHDLRFLNQGETVYLRPKGQAKRDTTGFVKAGLK